MTETPNSWKVADERLHKIVNHTINETLNVDTWKFLIPSRNKKISYTDLIQGITVKNISIDYVECMVEAIRDLQASMQTTGKLLKISFAEYALEEEKRTRVFVTLEKESTEAKKLIDVLLKEKEKLNLELASAKSQVEAAYQKGRAEQAQETLRMHFQPKTEAPIPEKKSEESKYKK